MRIFRRGHGDETVLLPATKKYSTRRWHSCCVANCAGLDSRTIGSGFPVVLSIRRSGYQRYDQVNRLAPGLGVIADVESACWFTAFGGARHIEKYPAIPAVDYYCLAITLRVRYGGGEPYQDLTSTPLHLRYVHATEFVFPSIKRLLRAIMLAHTSVTDSPHSASCKTRMTCSSVNHLPFIGSSNIEKS